jgi:5-methylthioadenosine/S-adenosylhomocysteine deaminase
MDAWRLIAGRRREDDLEGSVMNVRAQVQESGRRKLLETLKGGYMSLPERASGVTLLVGGAVVTIDSERRTLDPGAVAVENDRILAVGGPDELRSQYIGAREVDLRHAVIMPGLVDSHGHAGHGMTKGIAPGADWLETIAKVYFHGSDEAFWRAESFLSALEHIEFGVTTSLSMAGSNPRIDHPRYAVAAAAGYQELGLRHITALGPPGGDPPWNYTEIPGEFPRSVDLDHALKTTADAIDQLHNSAEGRVLAYVGPSSLTNGVDERGAATDAAIAQLRGVHDLASAKGVGVHAHAYGGQIRAAADAFPDILNEKLVLAHCTGISADEIRIMAEAGVSATHGPLTKAYARERFPLIEALDGGVNVVISTDGSGPDRSFDLLAQGRVAAQLQHVHFHDTFLLPAGKVLEMMTIDPAKALGLDHEIGSLEPGKKADIIALNLRSARMYPRMMLPQRLVYVGSGLDVEFMMVDGRTLMESRSYDWVDIDAILDEAQRAASESFERAGVLDALREHPREWGEVRYK